MKSKQKEWHPATKPLKKIKRQIFKTFSYTIAFSRKLNVLRP